MWPGLRLLAEDLVWCPEIYITYWGFTPQVNPDYDYLETALCHGEFPHHKWQKTRISNFDSVHKAKEWHRYGFEWATDRARSDLIRIDKNLVGISVNMTQTKLVWCHCIRFDHATMACARIWQPNLDSEDLHCVSITFCFYSVHPDQQSQGSSVSTGSDAH